MSGTRGIWTDGQANTSTDHQRVADSAASADDSVLQSLFSDSQAKFIVPLSDEVNDSIAPRLLVLGSGTPYTIQRALYVSKTSPAGAVKLSAKETGLPTGGSVPNPASNGGATRYDLLYATIQRSVTTTGSRRVKATDGTVSTQPLNLASDPVVTYGLVQGVSSSTPLASLPADTSTAWNFGLARLQLDNGYSSGGAIAQSHIQQLWTGGGIDSFALPGVKYGSLVDGSPSSTGQATTPLSTRWQSYQRFVIPVKHTSAQTITLDGYHDWRKRIITVKGIRSTDAGSAPNFPPFESVATVGKPSESFNSGPLFTYQQSSIGSTSLYTYTYVSSGETSKHVDVFVRSANTTASNPNRLQVVFDSSPKDGSNGDNWVFIVEATDQFEF